MQSMTLAEALEIKRAIDLKKGIDDEAHNGKTDQRLHVSWVNLLAGFTVNFCQHFGRDRVTRKDLSLFRQDLIENLPNQKPKMRNVIRGQIITIEKILEHWKDDIG